MLVLLLTVDYTTSNSKFVDTPHIIACALVYVSKALIQQARPRLTGTPPTSHAGMTRPVAVMAEGHQIVHVVTSTITKVYDVVDLDTSQALALAVLALVPVPGEDSAA